MKAKIRVGNFVQKNSDFSRRKTFELIKDGKVKVNDQVCMAFAMEINPDKDKVHVNGQRIHKEALSYFIFNKPTGIISTMIDPNNRRSLRDFVEKARLPNTVFPVGRLDKATSGLLLFTNDGDLGNHILHPKFEVNKTYYVKLDKDLSKKDGYRLLSGLMLEDGPFKFTEIHLDSKKQMTVKLHEGRNRIIRRSFAALGYEVVGLKRLSINNVTLSGVKEGQFKKVTRKWLSGALGF